MIIFGFCAFGRVLKVRYYYIYILYLCFYYFHSPPAFSNVARIINLSHFPSNFLPHLYLGRLFHKCVHSLQVLYFQYKSYIFLRALFTLCFEDSGYIHIDYAVGLLCAQLKLNRFSVLVLASYAVFFMWPLGSVFL